MPKRTRVQQDQHNERRRIVKKEGRKAIFRMKYINAKYPDIHDEACEFFATVNERYPGKRDLSKTHEFKHIKDQPKNTRMLEPQLEIPLIPNNTVITPTNDPTTTTTEEIPPVIDLENEEIEKIIDELRQDPDLASVFNDIELPPVSAYTTVEYTQEEEIPPFDDLQIDFHDLQIDFHALGEDLPELDQEIDW